VVFFTPRFYPTTAGWLDATVSDGPWDGLRAIWFNSFLHPDGRPYDSPWRRESGALWDLGPHALSLAIPLLGPVTDISPAPGPGDTVHLVLQHASGAASTMSLSLSVAPAAATVDVAVYGRPGWRTMPAMPDPKVESLRAAVRQLIDQVTTQAGSRAPAHPCDVRFAREVVAVLETAQSRLTRP
jgi:hypothetical protein